jgi:hypothetical protein
MHYIGYHYIPSLSRLSPFIPLAV